MDTILVEFNKQFGFRETDRIKWNDKYAPKGWDYDRHGRPEIVTMTRDEKQGKKRSTRQITKDKIGKTGTQQLQEDAIEFVKDCLGWPDDSEAGGDDG